MKKFEEEFDNLMRAFVDYHDCFDFDTEKCYLELKKEFIEKYGKKQQPEIPEFVATEIEEKNRRFSNFHKTANIESYVKEVRDWYYEKPYHAELFYRAILDGYTVAEEKRFYLKHIEMSKSDEHNDYYMGKNPNGVLDHWGIKKGNLPRLVAILKLTQQEIDSMETGSYEQIEVGDD